MVCRTFFSRDSLSKTKNISYYKWNLNRRVDMARGYRTSSQQCAIESRVKRLSTKSLATDSMRVTETIERVQYAIHCGIRQRDMYSRKVERVWP